MKKLTAFLIIAIMVSAGILLITDTNVDGEDTDVLFNNAGQQVDGGTIELTDGGGMDTSYYFRVGKNVPISNAYINISTHDSHLGKAIQDPYVDVGVDGRHEWVYSDTGYGKFGEQDLFSDDTEKVSLNMPGSGGYNTQNSIFIPKDSEISSASMEIQGRFVPRRITEHQVMVDPATNAVQIQVMEYGDIDGDGDEDMVVSDIQRDRMVWFENPSNLSEDWTMHTITTSWYVRDSYGLDVGDIDGDGDLDMVCSSYSNGYIMYFRNNNNGSSWSMYRFRTGYRYAGTVKLADMDQDGDLDAVVAAWYTYYHTSDEFLYWFEAPNDPNTTAWSAHRISNAPYYYMYTYFGMDVADINGDDYPDVVASTYPRYSWYSYNQLAWYKNPKSNSGSWTKTVIDTSAQRVFSVDIADMDNDNDADIIAASYDGRAIKYYNQTYNNQTNTTSWAESSISTVYYPRYVKVLDFDGDGYNDTFFSGGSGNYEFSYLKQNGRTNSWSKTVLTNEVIVPQAFSVFDIDGDDDHDFWVSGTSASQLVQIMTEDIDTSDFETYWIYEGGIKDIRQMDYRDMDGDGDQDMIFISYDTGFVGWWENDLETDGNPLNSVGALHQLGVLGNGIKIMFADVDGDEDEDIVAMNTAGTIRWFRNDGDPHIMWNDFMVTSSVPNVKGFYAGDFTGDGKADVATSTNNGWSGGYVRLYQAPSDPTQSNWNYNIVANNIQYMSNIWADDLDLDGDLELIVTYGSWGSGSVIYLKNPTVEGGNPMSGLWNANNIGGGMYYPEDVKSFDINDDGYPDVIVTGRYYYSKVRWFENPGTGGSWKSRVIYQAAYNWYLEVGDIGGDGYADVIFNRGSYSSPSSILWLEEPDDLDSSWITHSIDSSHPGTYDIGIADLENDGIQEVLSSSTSRDEIRAYKIDAVYPSDFSLDIGADESTSDIPVISSLRGRHEVEFAQALQDTVNNPGGSIRQFRDSYGTEMLEIPLELYSSTTGKITLDEVSIRYNASVKIDQNGVGDSLAEVLDRIIPDYSDGDVYTRVYIGVGGFSTGMAYLSDFYVEFNAIPRQNKEITEFSVDEDTMEVVSDDLTSYFRDDYTDPEDLDIDVYLKGPKKNKIQASIVNNRLVIDSTITENFYTRTSEPYDITGVLVVTDDGGPNDVPARSMKTKEFPIFVRPVNDDPVLTGETLPSVRAYEGKTTTVLDLDEYDLFYDVDGDKLQYKLIPDLDFEEYNESAEFSIKRIKSNNTLEVSLHERSDWTGTVAVTLYATDKQSLNYNLDPRVEFLVHVVNINDGPSWSAIPMVTVTEDIMDDRVIELSQFGIDMDTPRSELDIMVEDYTNKSFITIQIKETQDNLKYLTFTPKVEHWVGMSEITLQLSDGEFFSTTSMMLNIEPVNDLPSIRITEPSENGRVEPGTFSIVGETKDVEGIEYVEVLFGGEWYKAIGTNSWGVTLEAVGMSIFQEEVPIQARCYDGTEFSIAYVNITILPIEEKVDLDWDDDGVLNSQDKFPYNPSEWDDSDGDGIGDNTDPFPFSTEWASDLDRDGIADLAEEDPYVNDPENRPITEVNKGSKDEQKYDLLIPIILAVIALILAVVLALSIVAYNNKKGASRDPRKMAKYYAKQQRFREKRHDIIEKLPLAKAMDSITNRLGGGGAQPSSSLPTPSRPGGPSPTMVRQPMNLPPGMQGAPQRQLPPMPPQQIRK